jgi:hypothetical protein
MQSLERRLLLAAAITPIGAQPTGALTGKIVFTSGGHGFTADFPGTGGWSTQRGLTNSMVEDFGNQEQMTAYVNYLFNAGATIVPMRPVGNQPNEVVLDNDSPGVTFSGTWSDSTSTIFFGTAGDVPYRFASTSATETAVAKYTPNISVAGFYPVYGWAQDGSNRATDQLYRITQGGGATEVRVNHRRVGKGWVYLGTYYFEQGTGGYVEISNASVAGGAGSVVIADAIRFGNGMGDVNRGAGVSGHTREDEAALYWIMRSAGVGTASTVYAPNGDDATDNVGAPARWAAYMNAEGQGLATDRIYLGFHSNASDGTSRGTLGLYNSPANATVHQQAWAELVGREINDDLVQIGSPPLEFSWFNRSVVTLDRSDIDFGEIRADSINNEMDATIAEVAFHDNTSDAALLRDPKARGWIGRAAYQATVRYFATYPTTTAVNLLPDAPTRVRTSLSQNGNTTVSWTPPVANSVVGNAASGYRLYASKNGYGFDGGIFVSGGGGATSYTVPAGLLDNGVYYFRVAAVNAGGESPPSEVATARKSAVARPKVLIVNGFDRLDRTQDIRQSTSLSPGGAVVMVDRVRPRLANSFDYVVQVAGAIMAAGGDVEINSSTNEDVAAGLVDLTSYAAVFWISGEESTADHTFTASEQTRVKGYLDGGGKLFVSGSEIGWDLDAQNNGATFYNQTLKADYVADDANTYSASGSGGSIFAGIALNFDNGSQVYNVDFPDVISPLGGASLAMTYSTGGGAAITYSSGNERLVMLGFGFEAITSSDARSSVMDAVLTFFKLQPAVPPPPDLVAASDSGTSNSDNITSFDNSTPGKALQFTVSGTTAGVTVRLYVDGVLFASAPGGVGATTLMTDGVTDLADGMHNFTATQFRAGDESMPSPVLALTIDTVAPTVDIVDVAPDPRSAPVSTIDIRFSERINGFPISKFTLTRNGVPRLIGSVIGGGQDWTLTGLEGVTGASGGYRLELTAAGSGVTDIAGNALAQDAMEEWLAATPYLEGTAAADTYWVRYNPEADAVEVFENTAPGPCNVRQECPTYSMPRASLPFLNFGTLGGDDVVNIDVGGMELPIRLDLGDGADTLNINGGTVDLQSISGIIPILENLTIGPDARLDMGAQSLILQPSAGERDGLYQFLIPLLHSGRNRGDWNGLGINSSIAAQHRTSAGVALLLNDHGDGTTILGGFGGQPLDANSILISYQLIGDLDFDGDLDADDYARIDSGFASHVVSYQNGDLDYGGGAPNADDYFLIDRAFAEQIAGPPAQPRPAEAATAAENVSRITVQSPQTPSTAFGGPRHGRKVFHQWRHRWKSPLVFRFRM